MEELNKISKELNVNNTAADAQNISAAKDKAEKTNNGLKD